MHLDTRVWLTAALALLAGTAAAPAQTPPSAASSAAVGSDLPYPPSARPAPGDIQHVATGLPMSFDGMMEMISGARLVSIGETHDNIWAHRSELRIIEALYHRFPGRVAIGMEMFRQPQQGALDRWTRGELSELEFLKATDWAHTWGMDFGYYRGILEFARDNHVDVIALDPDQALQDQVRAHGLDALPADVRAQLPDIGEPDRYERAAMKAIYGGHLPTEGMFDSFFRVQLLWEESMAARLVDYLRSERGSGKIVVTLTGAWHVRYGFGVPRKVLRRMPLSYVIVEPTEIEIPKGKDTMNVDLPAIPLLPADFIWWVPYEDLSAVTPHLGVQTDRKAVRLVVTEIEAGSPAERAGLRPGDEIVAVAGNPVDGLTELQYWIGRQRKGATAAVTVVRGGQRIDLQVTF